MGRERKVKSGVSHVAKKEAAETEAMMHDALAWPTVSQARPCTQTNVKCGFRTTTMPEVAASTSSMQRLLICQHDLAKLSGAQGPRCARADGFTAVELSGETILHSSIRTAKERG